MKKLTTAENSRGSAPLLSILLIMGFRNQSEVKPFAGLDRRAILRDIGSLGAIEIRREPTLFSLLRQSGVASLADDHLCAPAVTRPCKAERNGFGP
jgi:hypothetical protein